MFSCAAFFAFHCLYLKELKTLHAKLVANEGNLLDLSLAGRNPVLAYFPCFLGLFCMLFIYMTNKGFIPNPQYVSMLK